MTPTAFPVLWLCGPPGVGKSTVGWELFAGLDRAGGAVGYVDIDQLAMSFPTTADDPERDRMKARNVRAVIANARRAGARCVIVSGVLEVDAVELYEESLAEMELTWVLLGVGDNLIAERLARRGWSDEAIADSLQNAASMAASRFADVSIDTTRRSVHEVAALVREYVAEWPPADASTGHVTAPVPTVTDTPGSVLWVSGPIGVGKSSVAWAVFQDVLTTGVAAAFVDLGQLGFCRPAPPDDPANHRLVAANLAALWATYADAGADCLIVNGRVDSADDVRSYTDALPAASVTLCRLTAGRDELTRRILRRGEPGGLELAGDQLLGQPDIALWQVIERAMRNADELERAGIGDLRVETDGRSVAELARDIRSLAQDWPLGARARR